MLDGVKLSLVSRLLEQAYFLFESFKLIMPLLFETGFVLLFSVELHYLSLAVATRVLCSLFGLQGSLLPSQVEIFLEMGRTFIGKIFSRLSLLHYLNLNR